MWLKHKSPWEGCVRWGWSAGRGQNTQCLLSEVSTLSLFAATVFLMSVAQCSVQFSIYLSFFGLHLIKIAPGKFGKLLFYPVMSLGVLCESHMHSDNSDFHRGSNMEDNQQRPTALSRPYPDTVQASRSTQICSDFRG